ncbi:MAG: helix-turn-helix domain-containing protein [Chloroflexi bacterium]|nr:helix-turn-helix domain-containing protein [Chloroflexota bacterium]
MRSPPLLAVSEVAQLLGVHINTVRKWGDRGILPVYRLGPRRDRRFRREDVILFLKG